MNDGNESAQGEQFRLLDFEATCPNDKVPLMGFTGSLILARTQVSLIDMLAPHEAEFVGRRDDDHWQLAAVMGDSPDIPGWAAELVEAMAAPVLIAVVGDSDTAAAGRQPRRASVDHGAQRPARQRGPGSGRRLQGGDRDRRGRCLMGS